MHLEVLVEGHSDEKALTNLIPKIIGGAHTFGVYPFGNKQRLLEKLLQRLKAYSKWITEEYRIVVLIDEDRKDCHELKKRLIEDAIKAGIEDKVLARIAVEELEAWFFGDIKALQTAYPKLPKKLGNRSKLRDPDAISGGTWEYLERIIRKAGYPGYRKIAGAELIAQHMDPDNNRSRSFQVFRDGLLSLVAG